MHKILIIGNPGAGKSTFSIALGKLLDLPVIHLDYHFWNSGWIETDKEIWKERVKELMAGERWIIDGYYRTTLDLRIPAADTIFVFDFPTLLCLWRALKRNMMNRKKVRPDMAPGCAERIDFEFYKWIWNFRKDNRPYIFKMLEKYAAGKKITIFKKSSEVARFLEQLSYKSNR